MLVEEGNFPLVPFPLLSYPGSSCSEVLTPWKKLNNHIAEIHKDPTSCIICQKTFKGRSSLYGTALCTSHHHTPARPMEKPLVEETAPQGT